MNIVTLPIVERLLSVIPTGSPGISGLLRIVDIIEDPCVPTAQIDCKSPPYIRINPEFAQQHAATAEHLTMLVMHELFHLVLGHTRLYPRVTPADNIVFDAIINAMLCRMYPEDAFTSFFTGYYRDSQFPDCLLRPPGGWVPTDDEDEVPTPPGLAGEGLGYAASVYRALYSSGCTDDELRSLLESPEHGVSEGDLAGVPLLGDHRCEEEGASSGGDLERRAPGLLETIRAVVEKWPQPPAPIAGTSLEDLLSSLTVPRVEVSPQSALERMLRRVGAPRRSDRLRSGMQDEWATLAAVRTRLDRRGFVADALGQKWLLGTNTLPMRRMSREAGVRTHVYLDVSGSVGDILPCLIGAMKRYRAMVHPVVHMFSTKVVDIAIGELVSGVIATSWGTNVECVASHMSEHGVRRAVLVTDGYVGTFGVSTRRILERAMLGVALVGWNCDSSHLKSVANVIDTIDLKGLST
jgi:hypothetical protein